MAYIPVTLEFDTETLLKTVGPGQMPIHSYAAPSGWRIMSWGWTVSGYPGIVFSSAAVFNDGQSFNSEVENTSANSIDITYTFTLIKA